MSINTLLPSFIKKYDNTVIAPCNPKDIRYCEDNNGLSVYILNYVVRLSNGRVKPMKDTFHSYKEAYVRVNEVRTFQGFDKLPPFKPYKG